MSLADDLAWLIGIPSPTGEEEVLCTALARRLSPRFGADALLRVGNSLVVGRPGPGTLITLYGHLDTVPAQGNATPQVREGRVFGLGASDMKAGVAVMLALLEDPEAAAGPYRLSAVFYDKEEGPAHENGLEAVLDSVGWLSGAALAVVLEPTDLELQPGCQGALNARVTFLGEAAHSSRPWLGVNAITRAGEWLAAMHRRPPVPATVGGLEFQEVMSVTTAHGGLATNVVPARFDLNLNYRFPPGLTLEEAETRLREAAAPADEVEIFDRAPAALVPAGNPHLERLARITGARRSGKQGWTDVARLSARDIPAVNYGPGEVALCHRADESVAVASLETAFAALKRFLTEG
ncbi:MAG TPA: succinyl-diaminopimelate desuccinylase [Acidimicrobiia bacterium]|nr:succinyl-diaminopimelate desuccinylase [Acidimicrobiia bacterium]